MDPQKAVSEYISAIGAGIRFILTLVISAIIAGKITKFFGTDNFFAYALALLCVAVLIYSAIDFYLGKRKSKKTRSVQRGGYD
jgi:threonine/homoserine/homoserine lactone efflux protein